MSSKQGPREAGMRASANAAGHRPTSTDGSTQVEEVA